MPNATDPFVTAGVVPTPPAAPPVAAPVVPPTTTTVATVTTTTTPAARAVPWKSSLKFRAYVGSWLTLVFGWLIENISTHQWDFHSWTWIAITVSTIVLARSIVGDWMNPAVVAPFAAMNKQNSTP